jgi:hypothetical protein
VMRRYGRRLKVLSLPSNAAMKELAMHCLIKVSDLGHIYAPNHVHQRWVRASQLPANIAAHLRHVYVTFCPNSQAFAELVCCDASSGGACSCC